jgi:hypothetical protein
MRIINHVESPSTKELESLFSSRRGMVQGDVYWQDFLAEFHRRQRERSVARSRLGLCLGRLTEWAKEVGPSKWIYGAGLAYAGVTVMLFLSPRSVLMDSFPPSRVQHMVVPAPAVEEVKEEARAMPAEQEEGGEVF